MIWFGASCLATVWLSYVWIIGLTRTSLFILGAITGLIFAPMFPLSFAFFNQRLNVIPMLLGLLLTGTAIGAMTLNKIAGKPDTSSYALLHSFSEYLRCSHGL